LSTYGFFNLDAFYKVIFTKFQRIIYVYNSEDKDIPALDPEYFQNITPIIREKTNIFKEGREQVAYQLKYNKIKGFNFFQTQIGYHIEIFNKEGKVNVF
jgi:hypothetical protein